MIFENLLLALWQALDTFIVKDVEHTALCGPMVTVLQGAGLRIVLEMGRGSEKGR